MIPHTLAHSLHPEATGCTHTMAEITACVICGRRLAPTRAAVDTCSGRCRKRLEQMQATAAQSERLDARVRGMKEGHGLSAGEWGM